jgi:hypothetical protein
MDLHTGGPEDRFELTCSRDEEVAHGKEFSCDGEVNLNFKKRPEYMKKLKKKNSSWFQGFSTRLTFEVHIQGD